MSERDEFGQVGCIYGEIEMAPPGLTPQQFLANWRGTTLSERSSYQAHFNEVCQLVGYETPTGTGVDAAGNTFMFEYSLKKQAGGQGYADVYLENHFAIEYKAPDRYKDLRAAYDQLLQYREQLKNPPLLVVTDIANWEIHTNWPNTETRVYRFTHQDIAERPSVLDTVRNLFYDPPRLHPRRNTEQVTQDAAEVFRIIADNMRGWQAEPDRIARFLTKLVFCLFAEDVSLLPSGPQGEVGIFSEIIERTRVDSERFVRYTHDLFRAMAEGGEVMFADIPYFNGSLFEDVAVERLELEALTELARASRLNWEAIEPAIFGTLFERSLDPAKRAQLGAHYTSRDDILLIVEPVLMRPLEREWERLRAEAQTYRERLDSATTKKAQTLNRNKLAELREQMLARLRETTVLDPACGSGNFLYVALQRLMDMEKAVINDPVFEGLQRPLPEVHPRQMYGIEKDPIAHALASIVVWIGWLQWKRANGYASYPDPILQDLSANIVCKDAILAYKSPLQSGGDEASASPPPGPLPAPHGGGTTSPSEKRGETERGEPIEPDWPAVDVIVGNPPFLGGLKMLGELGDQYMANLRGLYHGIIPPSADLVCYWYEKARRQIRMGKAKRVGLLATNSIRGGVNREVLKRIKSTGDIFMAWSDRDWVLDGASVRVSMVGFDNGTEDEKYLDGDPTHHINADLTGQIDITIANKLAENEDLSFIGTQKNGSFDISASTAKNFLEDDASNKNVIRPWINGLDITRNPRNMWIIDFDRMSLDEAKKYAKPFEYVVENVKPARINLRQKRRREYWWQYGANSSQMRDALSNLDRYIGTARVAKHRLFI